MILKIWMRTGGKCKKQKDDTMRKSKEQRAKEQKLIDTKLAEVKTFLTGKWEAHEGMLMGFGSGGIAHSPTMIIVSRKGYQDALRAAVKGLDEDKRREARKQFNREWRQVTVAEACKLQQEFEKAGIKIRRDSGDIYIPIPGIND